MAAELMKKLYKLDRIRRIASEFEMTASCLASYLLLFSVRFDWMAIVSRWMLIGSIVAASVHSMTIGMSSKAIGRFLRDNPREGRLGARFKALRLALRPHYASVFVRAVMTICSFWLLLYVLVFLLGAWGQLRQQDFVAMFCLILFLSGGSLVIAGQSARAERFHARWLKATEAAGVTLMRTLP